MMVTMTMSGLQVGYSSHPERFRSTLELIRFAIGLYPAFDMTDLSHIRFMDLYLKLVWNYRDLLVLYFTMRCLRVETEPIIFDNVRVACGMLYYLVFCMSESMEDRNDFSFEDREQLRFDPGEMLDEMSYVYMQYTVWTDFMFEMYQSATMAKMEETLAGMCEEDKQSMRSAKPELEALSGLLWPRPLTIYHISRPVNYEVSVIPYARRVVTREMRDLEARMTTTQPDAETTIGFPNAVAPWVDVRQLVARPVRAPQEMGERV